MYKPPLILATLANGEWLLEVSDKRKFGRFDRLFEFVGEEAGIRTYRARVDQLSFRAGKRQVSDAQRERSAEKARRMMAEGKGIFANRGK